MSFSSRSQAFSGNLFIFMAAILFFTLSSIGCNPSIKIWVSPEGSDSSPGIENAPFLTLQRARDEVRKLNAEKRKNHDIIIYLKDGIYRLKEPLILKPQDSGQNSHEVIYRAAPGAKPVIAGSVEVTGWKLHNKKLNIYKAALDQKYRSRQFFVNGNRARRAYTELYNGHLPAGFQPATVLPGSYKKGKVKIGGGIQYIPTSLNPSNWRDPRQWKNQSKIEAVIHTQWKMMSVPVQSIQPSSSGKSGTIHMQQPAWTNANLYFTKSSNNKNCNKQNCDKQNCDKKNCNKSCETAPLTDGKPGIWSFWQVTFFENAYEFLDQPGEWYLDEDQKTIYYIPHKGIDMKSAVGELPVLETLIEGRGEPGAPVSHIRFEEITFSYATWMRPSSNEGYVSDQSGFYVTGKNHLPNYTGHVQELNRTPGNIKFSYAHNITFHNNTFEHLGAVGLDFNTGSQHNKITHNTFHDISSAAIQLGGIGPDDHHPKHKNQYTSHNTISNNTITRTGRDYVDSAAIFAGFTQNTLISHNTISDVPWSGIAMGWGWGLLDPSGFPGISCATKNMWGVHKKPTPNNNNKITHNYIEKFLTTNWDGGAIYTTGRQAHSMKEALLLEGNVAAHKHPKGGGNVFYTDGGSRYIKLKENVSMNNPIGFVNFGPPPPPDEPLPKPAWLQTLFISIVNKIPYGGDIGGCRTYGDISYKENYWREPGVYREEGFIDDAQILWQIFTHSSHPGEQLLYSKEGFFNICPYTQGGNSYPINLNYVDNHNILNESQIPARVLKKAGAKK